MRLHRTAGAGYAVYAVEQAQNSIQAAYAFAGSGKMAVIFGNEVTGVEQSIIAQTDGCIEIPHWA
jgi:23S rRNA (guanosine2251-2'-O)-methyltransferase